jgi:type III secretion protein J
MKRLFCLALLCTVVGCEAQVQHGLDEKEANEIQAALTGHGIESSKVPEGGRKPSWAVAVPSRRASEAVQVLAEQGLPRVHSEGLRETYGKGGLVPSASEERALYMGALSGELSQTLESYEGVLAARVHLVLPPAPRSGIPQEPAKAAVFLKIRPDSKGQLEKARDDIRALVAGSVDGLRAQDVTLVLSESTSRRSDVAAASLASASPDAMGLATPVCLVSGAGVLAFGVTRRKRSQNGRGSK